MIEIKKGNIEDLYFFQGERIKNTWLGENVLNSKVNYYLICDDKEIISDFWIDLDNNMLLGIEKETILNNKMMTKILGYSKEEVDYVVVPIFKENVKILETLQKHNFVITNNEVQRGKTYYILRKVFDK